MLQVKTVKGSMGMGASKNFDSEVNQTLKDFQYRIVDIKYSTAVFGTSIQQTALIIYEVE